MLNKFLLVSLFILTGLSNSIANIFKIEDGVYFDIIFTTIHLFSVILICSFVLQDRKIGVIYKYLSISILFFIFWDTLSYYLFLFANDINFYFITLQYLSYLGLIVYGVWKACIYDAQRELNKKHNK